jgi:hypothetical protein
MDIKCKGRTCYSPAFSHYYQTIFLIISLGFIRILFNAGKITPKKTYQNRNNKTIEYEKTIRITM